MFPICSVWSWAIACGEIGAFEFAGQKSWNFADAAGVYRWHRSSDVAIPAAPEQANIIAAMPWSDDPTPIGSKVE
jgi:hypothetical protein